MIKYKPSFRENAVHFAIPNTTLIREINARKTVEIRKNYED